MVLTKKKTGSGRDIDLGSLTKKNVEEKFDEAFCDINALKIAADKLDELEAMVFRHDVHIANGFTFSNGTHFFTKSGKRILGYFYREYCVDCGQEVGTFLVRDLDQDQKETFRVFSKTQNGGIRIEKKYGTRIEAERDFFSRMAKP